MQTASRRSRLDGEASGTVDQYRPLGIRDRGIDRTQPVDMNANSGDYVSRSGITKQSLDCHWTCGSGSERIRRWRRRPPGFNSVGSLRRRCSVAGGHRLSQKNCLGLFAMRLRRGRRRLTFLGSKPDENEDGCDSEAAGDSKRSTTHQEIIPLGTRKKRTKKAIPAIVFEQVPSPPRAGVEQLHESERVPPVRGPKGREECCYRGRQESKGGEDHHPASWSWNGSTHHHVPSGAR